MRDGERDGGAAKAMADVKEFLGARPTVGTGRGGAREGVLPAMLPVVVVLVSGS